MLELRDISRHYKQKRGPLVKALDGVNLTFNEKGMIFVLGKSGSGKSTLLNVIGGLDKYTDGDLLIKGKSTKKFSQSEFDSYRNTMIGFIFQEYNVLDEFTVGQNIGIALELQGKKATSTAINEILDILDMSGYGNRKPNTLSGGQKQRVAIARALVKNPEIIMADEPTGALDSVTSRQLFETLKKLSKEKLVIVVTHDHEFAETYGDRIIEFSDGKIIRDVTKVNVEGETPNKTFSEEGITIKAGYQLTAHDLEQINKYLANNRDKTLLNVLNEDYSFKETEAITPVPETDKLSLIKSRLPFLSSLKMGASALNHRRIRLVLSILLSATAFTMFGLADTMASFKEKSTVVSTMHESNIEMSVVYKRNRIKYHDYYHSEPLKLSKDDITELNTIDSDVYFQPAMHNFVFPYNGFVGNPAALTSDVFYNNIPGLFATSGTTSTLTTFNLKLLAGTLPSAEKEIAIPEFYYNVFKDYDYKPSYSEPAVNINTPADLVGKKVADLTISGVVATGLDLSPFEDMKKEENQWNWQLINRYQQYVGSGFHSTVFLSDADFDKLVVDPSYKTPLSSYYSFTIDNKNSANRPFIYNFAPLENLKDNANLVMLDNSKTLATLSERDVILNAVSLKLAVSDMSTVVDNSIASIKSALLTNNDNDQAIENYMKEYYYLYGYEESDITPYTTWNDGQKDAFRSYYADAMFATNGGLYYRNPFQSEVTGEKLLLPELSTRLPSAVGPLAFGLTKQGDEEKKLAPYNIVGVIFDYFEFAPYDNYTSYPHSAFISPAVAEELELTLDGVYDIAIVQHGTNLNVLNKFLDINHYDQDHYEGTYFQVYNPATGIVSGIASTLKMLGNTFQIIGIIFAVFAALLLVNFITLSVAFKRQEIGILRAIGARGFDVSRIFMNEASIIATINYVITMTAVIAITIILNNFFSEQFGQRIVFLVLGIRQFVVVFLIAFGIAALSSFIPVYRLSRKKPIDAIKNR